MAVIRPSIIRDFHVLDPQIRVISRLDCIAMTVTLKPNVHPPKTITSTLFECIQSFKYFDPSLKI